MFCGKAWCVVRVLVDELMGWLGRFVVKRGAWCVYWWSKSLGDVGIGGICEHELCRVVRYCAA